jgi:DNA-binding NtrC family response regulator
MMKEAQTDGQKILVIDDEAGIRRGCDRVLRSEVYQVLMSDEG